MDLGNVNSGEEKLVGFNFTPEQLFWISHGQLQCSKYTDEALIQQIKTKPQSPMEFRLLGPLQNSKNFAKDFDCPPGSIMNPSSKCVVW